jgi:hypothetical protein
MKLTERLSSAREKFARFEHPEARALYKRTLHLREMPDGRCQVIRFISREDYERPDYRAAYEAGALVVATAASWKELGL